MNLMWSWDYFCWVYEMDVGKGSSFLNVWDLFVIWYISFYDLKIKFNYIFNDIWKLFCRLVYGKYWLI